jgi:hypothetical protein
MMSAADGERIIRLVVHHVGTEIHSTSPRYPQLIHKTPDFIYKPVLGR